MSRALLFVLCIAALSAQDSPTFRVDTRLVEVDVVVRRGNAPVAGLEAGDFTLFDRGKKQKIAIFSVRRDSEAQAPRSLAAGVVTNRMRSPTDGGETPSTTVILLDTLNSRPDDMAEVRQQLLRYLDRAPKQEVFALYSLNKTLNRLHDFTGTRDHLRDIVNRWIASASVDVMTDDLVADLIANLPTYDDQTAGMAEAVIKEIGDSAILNRASGTAFALELIGKHLSGLPGRKKLIWVSGGFPTVTEDLRRRLGLKQIETRDYSSFIDKATRALNEAQVAVYPIDSRRPCSPSCQSDPLLLRSGVDTMNLIAVATGGKTFYAVHDIAGAIEESVQDSEITYRLGFYPASPTLDGKNHDIKVQVAREGVDVRYRREYLAADSKVPQPAERRRLFRTSMESPLDSTQIGLTAQLLPDSVTGGGGKQVLLKIDTRTLQMTNADASKGGTVSTALITLATFFENRPKLPSNVNDLQLTFTKARLEAVLRDGYLIRLQVDERGVPGKLRVGVQDRSTGMTGSVTLDVR